MLSRFNVIFRVTDEIDVVVTVEVMSRDEGLAIQEAKRKLEESQMVSIIPDKENCIVDWLETIKV